MTKLISAASHAASKSPALAGNSIKRSHLQEVMAAMFGYHTFAALSLEEADPGLERHLDDAEMIVLDPDAGAIKVASLGLGDAPAIVEACSAAIHGCAQARVFDDLDAFYDDYAREEMVDAITHSDDVSAAMSETNAYFDGEAELPEQIPSADNLWAARADWSIEARGDLKGGHDIDSDRMFAGDTLNCMAKLSFYKAGRAGLIFAESDASAGVDESWREHDFDDEQLDQADDTDLSDRGDSDF